MRLIVALVTALVLAAPASAMFAPSMTVGPNSYCDRKTPAYRPTSDYLKARADRGPMALTRPSCGSGGAPPCNVWIPAGNGYWIIVHC